MVATVTEHRVFSRGFANVEASNDDDVFRNVSLCTKGEAKGHGVQIDDTTLKQLLECAKRFKNGVRANLGHFTGVENAFGYFTNLRIEGEKLLGDLNLFDEHPDIKLVKRQIRTIPDTIGFSVYFSGPDDEHKDEVEGSKVSIYFARCEELYSADLVTEPAANPSGVFQKGAVVDNKTRSMAEPTDSPDDIKKIISECMAEAMKPHIDRLEEIAKQVEEIGKNDTPIKDEDSGLEDGEKEEDKTKDSEMEDEDKEDGEDGPDKEEDSDSKKKPTAASRKPAKTVHNFTARDVAEEMLKIAASQRKTVPATATATSPASESASPKGKQKFSRYHDAYRSFRAAGKSKSESLQLSQRQYPELYKSYCKGQENREDWTREPLDEKNYSALALKGQLT